MGELVELLGEEDYEELVLSSIVNRANQGDFFSSLHPWLKEANPSFNWDYRYLVYIINLLQQVADGKLKKLMISCPPRHGKTELCSIHFPTYFLEKNPKHRVIVGTYNQTLANNLSRRIRSLSKTKMTLDPEKKAMEEWYTKEGGGVRAVGVGAGIAGVGANLIILDDVVRSRKDANSITIRNATYDWYTDDIYTRQEPNCGIVIIATRWHEDDLLGRIERGQDAKEWTIVNLPAIAETNDQLGRQPGEALNPERYPVSKLNEIRNVLGRGFYALYQGRPTEQEGEVFKASWFRSHTFSKLPVSTDADKKKYTFCRFWDLASTADDGDYTVGVLMAIEKVSKTYYIVNVMRGQWSTDERNKIILETCMRDKITYGELGRITTCFEQEPGSSGKDFAKVMIKLLSGFAVKAIKSTGDKKWRLDPYAAQVEGGNVYTKSNTEWFEEFIDEHCIFPNGKNDDQPDAASGAFNFLSKGRGFIWT